MKWFWKMKKHVRSAGMVKFKRRPEAECESRILFLDPPPSPLQNLGFIKWDGHS